jgi:nucleotide-binding universal stress UspA family protein
MVMDTDTRGRVILGVDGSLAGLRALRLAVTEARRRNATLYAVRVWPMRLAGPAFIPFDDERRQSMTVIDEAFAAAVGGPPTDVKVVACAPAGEIGPTLTDYASRDDDLLVVGSARGGLRRLRRSVSRYCTAHATCPVMVVPADAFARLASKEHLGRAIRRDVAMLS